MTSSITNAVPVPVDAIKWHDGLLLAPVHFEQLSQRQEELLAYQLRAATPYAWGVRQMAFDRQGLATGALALTRLEAVMPDGRLVAHESDATSLKLQLADTHIEELQRNPRARHVVCVVLDDVPADAPATSRRFSNPDAATLARVRPGLQLMLETDIQPERSHLGMPVGRLKYENLQVQFDEFLPPLLDIAVEPPDARPSLRSRTENLLERLAASEARLAALVLEARERIEQLEWRERLGNVAGALPPLHGMLGLQSVAPLQLYMALCAVLGPLRQLRDMGEPLPELPDYQHADPQRTFAMLFGQVDALLQAVAQPYITGAFERSGEVFERMLDQAQAAGWPAASLHPGSDQQGAPVLLVRLAGLTDMQAQKWLASAVIASAEPFEGVRARRELGAARYRIDDDGTLHALVEAGATVPSVRSSVAVHGLRTVGATLLAVQVDPEMIQAGQLLKLEGQTQPCPREVVLLVSRANRGGVPA
jgi:type VI secretion system protein ImpJ